MPNNQNANKIRLSVPSDKKGMVVDLLKIVHDESKNAEKKCDNKRFESLEKAKEDLAAAHAEYYHSKSPTKLTIALPKKGCAKLVGFIEKHQLKESAASAAASSGNDDAQVGNGARLFSNNKQSAPGSEHEKNQEDNLSPKNK